MASRYRLRSTFIAVLIAEVVIFFSGRRGHTRWPRDWSSDVCSSDLARKLIFKKWKEALGGNLKAVASGAAPLQPRLARIFNAAGIPIMEGYGLTETSPVIAVNDMRDGGFRIGTVGKLLRNTDVKIADDGEILIKGPDIMMGHYKYEDLAN